MNNSLKQLKSFKTLTLTEEERGLVRAHAMYLMMNTPTTAPVSKSIFQRGVYLGLRIALSSFLFFVFIGGTVSAVADSALPGDPLYAFKLNVNEEVKGFFQKTPEEKVAYGAKRVETRVNEIKTLAASKTLTKAKQATVQKALDAHIKELSTDLSALSSASPTTALSVTTDLEEALKENKALIEQSDTLDTADKEQALTTVASTIEQVSNQEVKIISKELDAISSDITTTPDPTTTLSVPASSQKPTSTPVGP